MIAIKKRAGCARPACTAGTFHVKDPSVGRFRAVLRLATVLLAFTLSTGVQAQEASMATEPLALARAVLGALPGQAVAGVWRQGRTTVAGVRRASGAPDAQPLPESEVSGEAAALYEIGSISKVFTGVLLAQSIEAGELSLDDTLGKLLEGKAQITSPYTAAVTLRQLVTHTACLPRLPADFRQERAPEDPYRGYGRERLWAAVAALQLPAAPPCEAVYSNFGFAVIGEILSGRAGKPWAQLVRERITVPLGMRDTVQVLDGHASRLAPAFAGQKPTPPWEMQAFAGAGGLRSTPRDLLLFGRAIAAGRNGPLGAAAERLVAPQARFDGDIGLAIFIAGPPARRTFSHNGGTGGFASYLIVAPDTQEVMVLLASNSRTPLYRIGGEVLAGRYPATAQPAALDAARLPEYTGVFRENKANALSFAVQDGVLHVRATGQRFMPLTPAGTDTFVRGRVTTIMFVREAGAIVGVNWSNRGAERSARRTDEPAPQEARLAQDILQAYAGNYRSRYAPYTVRAEDGQLSIQNGENPPLLVFPVPGQPDRFAYDLVAAEAAFERYPSGQVRALVIHERRGALRADRVD